MSQHDPDSVMAIARAADVTRSEIMGRVHALIQAYSYDAVVADEHNPPFGIVLHHHYADTIRLAYGLTMTPEDAR
jgi:hypothetical protein